jgi:hypothetical protein
MPFHHSSTGKSGYPKHFPSVKGEYRRKPEGKKGRAQGNGSRRPIPVGIRK